MSLSGGGTLCPCPWQLAARPRPRLRPDRRELRGRGDRACTQPKSTPESPVHSEYVSEYSCSLVNADLWAIPIYGLEGYPACTAYTAVLRTPRGTGPMRCNRIPRPSHAHAHSSHAGATRVPGGRMPDTLSHSLRPTSLQTHRGTHTPRAHTQTQTHAGQEAHSRAWRYRTIQERCANWFE